MFRFLILLGVVAGVVELDAIRRATSVGSALTLGGSVLTLGGQPSAYTPNQFHAVPLDGSPCPPGIRDTCVYSVPAVGY